MLLAEINKALLQGLPNLRNTTDLRARSHGALDEKNPQIDHHASRGTNPKANTNSNNDSTIESQILTRSPVMQALLAEARIVSATNASVLILGDTGSGKELLAQTMHDLSLDILAVRLMN